MQLRLIIAAVLAFTFTSASLRPTAAAEPLRPIRTIPLAGVEGRIDHLAVDVDGQRLFVAALGNNTVEVIDLEKGNVVHHISGLKEPQGVAFLKDQGLIAVANGNNGLCQFFSADKFDSIAAINFQADADNLRYDPGDQRLYVGYGNGALGVMDARARKRLDDIKLPRHPESFQLEQRGTRIFVNVPGSRQIAVLDRKSSTTVATWPIEQAQDNFPMTLDEESHQLFVGCRRPAEILVYDTDSGKVTSRFPTVGDTDDLFYDTKTKRLYVIGGEGFVTVYQRDAQDKFSQVAKIPTAAGARTGLFVPALSRLFVAVPHRGSQQAEVRVLEIVP